MKRILIVIDSLNSGGAEKSLISLLSLFDYKKYKVDLLMFSQEGLYLPLLPEEVGLIEQPTLMIDNKTLLKKKKIKEIFLKLQASLSLRIQLIKRTKMHSAQIMWKNINKGFKEINQYYDVAIAYSQGMPTYFVAEKVNAGKKISWINIDYKVASYNKEFDKRFYNQMDNVVAVSDLCRNVLIEELPEIRNKTSVIYDIISPKLIKLMSVEKGGFNDNYGGIKILTIGRLVHQKGYEYAIEACYKLKEAGIDFKWYAIGEGILKNKLKTMINKYGLEEHFILLGTTQNPYTFLNQCDFYVQPSRYEGFGLAIAEARILQKPIIATDFTIVHNQIINRENGLIVKMDSEDLFQGIKKLVYDNNLRGEIQRNLKKERVGTEGELIKVYSLIEQA